MDLASIEKAVASYRRVLDADDRARLDLFLPIWEEMDRCVEELDISGLEYSMPDDATIEELYGKNEPILSAAPVRIDASLLVSALRALTDVLAAQDGYPQELREELASIQWSRIVEGTDLGKAGSAPVLWIDEVADKLAGSGFSPHCVALGVVIASLSLHLFLQAPASAIMEALEGGRKLPHSLTCPVCGSAPVMSQVGGKTSSAGRGRTLVCNQCGSSWEFERIRCARCGTREQSQLTYRHIDDDDAHRLAICKKCGGTIRTVFSEDAEAPFSAEVEDVVMAKLDALSRA